MAEKRWAGLSRSAKRVANTLGIVAGRPVVRTCRSDKIEKLDKYYDGTQYDHLIAWDTAMQASADGDYISVRSRKPRIHYKLAAAMCEKVASLLIGGGRFPQVRIEDDPDTEEFLKLVMKRVAFKSMLIEPLRRQMAAGSVFVRFYFVEGSAKLEHYLSNYCYPTFQPNGELENVRIQYVWEDEVDRDSQGNPTKKWYRLDLGMMSETLYDTPDYQEAVEPSFVPVSTVAHNLGYVQGEWFRTAQDKHSPDGYGLFEDVLDFLDELNYSLSQSSQANSYNQDPQTLIKGMDSDEIENLVRSASKAWNLGRDGEASTLDIDMEGVKVAIELRDKMRMHVQDVARVVLMDPEKMATHAESGKALEILHGPLVDLVHELRPMTETHLVNLLLKIAVTMLQLMQAGVDVGIEVPKGWAPASLDVFLKWPAVFPLTIEDLQKKVAVAAAASAGNFISRETACRYVAEDFGVEDIEEEMAKIAAQPVLNPFGSF